MLPSSKAKKSLVAHDLDLGTKKNKATQAKAKDPQNAEEVNEDQARERFNLEEINKEFRRSYKKYNLFKVTRSPCIQDLNEYISFYTDLKTEDYQSSMADKNKDNLIYYTHKKAFNSQLTNFSLGIWLTSVVADIVYFFVLGDSANVRFGFSNCSMVLTSLNFIIPTLIKVGEAWTNAVFYRLFEKLQIEDYNKKFNSQIQNQASSEHTKRNSMLTQTYKELVQKQIFNQSTCQKLKDVVCCRRKHSHRDLLEEQKSHKKGKHKNTIKPDGFYQANDFDNRSVLDI